MKAILIFSVLFTMSFTCFSQSADNYGQPMAQATFVSNDDSKTTDNSRAHNQAAIMQLSDHIAKNISYPELMVEYAIEGTVKVEVSLTENGKVLKSRILESPSDSFDAVVLKAIKTFGAVDTKGIAYAGVPRIIVPIRFSL